MLTIKEKILFDSHGARISPAFAKHLHHETNILNTEKQISLLRRTENNRIKKRTKR